MNKGNTPTPAEPSHAVPAGNYGNTAFGSKFNNYKLGTQNKGQEVNPETLSKATRSLSCY